MERSSTAALTGIREAARDVSPLVGEARKQKGYITMTDVRRRLALLALAAVATVSIFAVACGDDDDGDDGGAGAPTATRPAATEPADEPTEEAEPTEPTAGGSATIIAREAGDLGTILTTSDGFTLYTFDNDTPGSGTSACNDACASAWPPFPVADATASGASGEIGTITRADGSPQTTYNGKPLYMYSGDAAPGDTNGDGVGGVWHVAKP
jgi:predicted lipoprotein with Yx(FWY)xxD motif